ncbi:hypothetical protein RYH80_11225 [Halobaculum sp. MBLA0147]|uniref:hypothetical protein n=1 Tax=Halobaculum sp. MBLA0147 TaxID=3079934 RepID=UPI0035248856
MIRSLMYNPEKYDTYRASRLGDDIELRVHEKRGRDVGAIPGVNPDSQEPLVGFYIEFIDLRDASIPSVVGIEHDPRPYYNGYDMFEHGIVVRFLKNGYLKDERRYLEPDRLEGLTNDECLSVAYRAVHQHVDTIVETAEI